MSEVAGRILMSGIPGVKGREKANGKATRFPACEPTFGFFAAFSFAGMGATVTLADVHIPRLPQLRDVLAGNVTALCSTQYNIENELPDTDLVIGAGLVPGAKTPHLVTQKILGRIRLGTIIVDVAIDQAGSLSLRTQQRTGRPLSKSRGSFTTASQISQCQSRPQARRDSQ
jgi:alanine dehydrogenase